METKSREGVLSIGCVRRRGQKGGENKKWCKKHFPLALGWGWRCTFRHSQTQDSHTNTHTHTDTSSEILPSLLPAQPTANRLLRILLQIHKTPKTRINEKWLCIHSFTHSCIHMFYKYWLGTYYVPGSLPDGEWTVINKTGAYSTLKALNLERIWSV